MDHGRCTTHEFYGLDCTQFEALRERAADACELCRTPGGTTHRTRLRIDHSGASGRGVPLDIAKVRGLLCEADNTRMGKAESRRTSTNYTEAQIAYVANSFWSNPETWPNVHPAVARVRAAVAEANRASDKLTAAIADAGSAAQDISTDLALLRHFSS